MSKENKGLMSKAKEKKEEKKEEKKADRKDIITVLEKDWEKILVALENNDVKVLGKYASDNNFIQEGVTIPELKKQITDLAPGTPMVPNLITNLIIQLEKQKPAKDK